MYCACVNLNIRGIIDIMGPRLPTSVTHCINNRKPGDERLPDHESTPQFTSPQPNDASNRHKINRSIMSDKFSITYIVFSKNKKDLEKKSKILPLFGNFLSVVRRTPLPQLLKSTRIRIQRFTVIGRFEIASTRELLLFRSTNDSRAFISMAVLRYVEQRIRFSHPFLSLYQPTVLLCS